MIGWLWMALSLARAAETCNGVDDDNNGLIDDGRRVCPGTVRTFGPHAWLFANRALTFWEAVGWCDSYGYDLATPSTPDENRWLWEMAWNGSNRSGLLNTSAWIGLYHDGSYHWVNGDHRTWHPVPSAAPTDGAPRAAFYPYASTPREWALAPESWTFAVVCESR